MRLMLLALTHIASAVVMLGFFAHFAVGAYTIWLDFQQGSSILLPLYGCIGISIIGAIAGLKLHLMLERKLQGIERQEYWDAEASVYYDQWDVATPSPQLVSCIYLLPFVCLLPLYYRLLPDLLFWIAASIFLAASFFCLIQLRLGLVNRSFSTTYYPRTQEFIDFYQAYIKGSEDQEILLQCIDKSSTDYATAEKLLGRKKADTDGIIASYINTSSGPGFNPTPENLLAQRKALEEVIAASHKTPEHLG